MTEAEDTPPADQPTKPATKNSYKVRKSRSVWSLGSANPEPETVAPESSLEIADLVRMTGKEKRTAELAVVEELAVAEVEEPVEIEEASAEHPDSNPEDVATQLVKPTPTVKIDPAVKIDLAITSKVVKPVTHQPKAQPQLKAQPQPAQLKPEPAETPTGFAINFPAKSKPRTPRTSGPLLKPAVPTKSTLPPSTGSVAKNMRTEIAEQPTIWHSLTQKQEQIESGLALLEAKPAMALFITDGSNNTASYAQYLIQRLLGVPSLALYPDSPLIHYPAGSVAFLFSTGSSPNMVTAANRLRESGVSVISITNDSTSSPRLGDVQLGTAAGVERSATVTKTFTAELLIFALMMFRAAGRSWAEITNQVAELSAIVAEQIANQSLIVRALNTLTGRERVLVVGCGYSLATAKEAAQKLMETSGIAASGWHVHDAIHGPLSSVNSGTVVLALTSNEVGREALLEFVQLARARGAKIVEVGPGYIRERHSRIDIPEVAAELTPLVEIVQLQRLALELAIRRDHDPDRPAIVENARSS